MSITSGNSYRVLQIIRSLSPEMGGTSESVPALAQATLETGRYASHLLDFANVSSAVDSANGSVPVRTLPWKPLALLAGASSTLRREIQEFDLVHVHGIWEPQCIASGRHARALSVPLVISAHGMLERWAVRNKRVKKTVYSALFERPNMQRAACLRALSQAEVGDYRRFGLRCPIVVIPNGVQAPANIEAERFLNRFPELVGKQLVLFLSRIHYKKGVDILCSAWAKLRRRFPDAHLVIAGPDFENTLSSIKTLVDELDIASSVTFTGMLKGDLKWSALKAASLFVLPSHSEGFSVAILEALSMGIPVIATHPCNFPEIAQHNAGVLIDPVESQLVASLAEMLSMPASALARVGHCGSRLVSSSYTWPSIGERMAEVYDWLLGGPLPASVEIDLFKAT